MSRSLFARLAARFEDRETRLRRREFLKLSALASSSLLLSGRALAREQARRKVLVVGAGLAGLSCAYELQQAGYEVEVLEARQRVGGRVLSFGDFVEGRFVEGGGELIGANHPLWNSYADRFGLSLTEVETYEQPEPWEFQGRILAEGEVEALYREMAAAFETLLAPAAAASPDDAELDTRSVADWLDTLELSPLTRTALRTDFETDNLAPLEQQSWLRLLLAVQAGGGQAYFTESETHRCAQGNQALAAAFAEALGGRLRPGCAVAAIELHAAGCRLQLAGGESLEADDCVLAVPPSVWQRISFDPSLPPELAPSMGPAVKFLAAVDPDYWQRVGRSPNSLGQGPLSYTWGAGGAQIGFSGGPAAVRLRHAGDESRELSTIALLERRYPNIGAAIARTRFMDWPAARFTAAGYSCPAPGEITALLPKLHQGLDERLHFAGEHTSLGFASFMEGALDSGARVARKLAQRDRVLRSG